MEVVFSRNAVVTKLGIKPVDPEKDALVVIKQIMEKTKSENLIEAEEIIRVNIYDAKTGKWFTKELVTGRDSLIVA